MIYVNCVHDCVRIREREASASFQNDESASVTVKQQR